MTRGPLVDIVVKVGGGLLAFPGHLDAVLAALVDAASTRRVLIVPGGGPFADAVRAVDRELTLSDDAAHWMAVLAMDQYAHLLVSRLRSAGLASDAAGIAAELDQGRLPVLAPSRWLRNADPLPHSWDVTSDSIAAWVAGEVGARRLVLVKPPGAGDQAVDPYFHRALPPEMASSHVVAADQIDALRRCLTV
jgi:aspartokinase-like uncharacterized kinase